MSNFTKEYIEFCKSDKIQGLKKIFHKGDWYCYPNGKTLRINNMYQIGIHERERLIWLPTGDQLDEEIVKICKGKKGIYEFKYYSSLNLYKGEVTATVTKQFAEGDDTNPLIAKIKLLLELLEVK